MLRTPMLTSLPYNNNHDLMASNNNNNKNSNNNIHLMDSIVWN